MIRRRYPAIKLTCEMCSAEFKICPSHHARGQGRFCSRKCAADRVIQDKQSIPLLERLEKNIYYEPNSGCWLWAGPQGHYGHPLYIDILGQPHIRVHRWMWEYKNGPLPTGLMICHKCDVPSCVNPDHLYAGTAADNMRDRLLRGRNPLTKLTPPQIIEIRKTAEDAKVTAERYGVTLSTIYHIRSKRSWRAVA